MGLLLPSEPTVEINGTQWIVCFSEHATGHVSPAKTIRVRAIRLQVGQLNPRQNPGIFSERKNRHYPASLTIS